MSPFPNSSRRRSAERLLKSSSAAARVMRELSHVAQSRSPDIATVRRHVNDLIRIAQREGKRKLSAKLTTVLRSITGAATAQAANAAVGQVLNIAGSAGRSLKRAAQRKSEPALLQQLRKDLSEAQQILAAMNGELNGEESGGRRATTRPNWQRFSGTPMPYNTTLTSDGKSIRIRTAAFSGTYKLTDSIITGKMIEVQSSNVHSIGFAMNYKHPEKSTLFIRFLGDRNGQRSGKGHLYEYFNINPKKFDSLRRAASSGEWVWDSLRTRGSRVQHQVKYNLKSVMGTSLPRRAAVKSGREMYVQRVRQTKAKFGEQPRTLRSHLPNQDLGPARGTSRPPATGRPHRGR